MFRSKWTIPHSPKAAELDSLLDELYPDEAKDKMQHFGDPKSKLRLQLALDGCTFSMVCLAKKIFEDHPVTDVKSMDVAFRWLLKAAREGDKAALAMLVEKRKFCPAILAPFVDNLLEKGYCDSEVVTTYAERIATRFKKMYHNADEEAVAVQVLRLISGETPACESVFAKRFRHTFGDLFALGLTLALGGFIGYSYLSSFDRLLSHKLAPAMDAFLAFLCTILLIVSIRTYSSLFVCGMYSKAMRLDSKYRDRPLPFRLRILCTQVKLQLVSLGCLAATVVLSILSFGKVSLTVFSCTTFLIALIDLLKHVHWWYTSDRVPDQYIGRIPLLYKAVTVSCVFCMFSCTKAEFQDMIITMSMTCVACSVLYLSEGFSVFAFSFLTSEYSFILQGLSVVKTMMFLIIRHIFSGTSRSVKALILVVLATYAMQCIPHGSFVHLKETTTKEVYDVCHHSTPPLESMVACSRLEGHSLSAVEGYVDSLRLVSRSNLLESIGLKHWTMDDGFIKIGVDSFEKVKVEVKLLVDYITATVIFDDDALDFIRDLQTGQYVNISGVIEQARAGPELRMAVYSIQGSHLDGSRIEIKQLGTAIRRYWRHIFHVIEDRKNGIHHYTTSSSGADHHHEL